MEKIEEQVMGLTAVYQTPEMIYNAVNSIKKFYPRLQLILVNNSPALFAQMSRSVKLSEKVTFLANKTFARGGRIKLIKIAETINH